VIRQLACINLTDEAAVRQVRVVVNCHRAIGGAANVQFNSVGAQFPSPAKRSQSVFPFSLRSPAVRYYLNLCHITLIIAEVFLHRRNTFRNTSMNFAFFIVRSQVRS
jgi:hypothetical protein